MKKILIRSGMSPLLDMQVKEVVRYNRIGDNVGNLVYIYSIFRTLMTDDVELIPSYYKINSLKPEEINEKYDAFVIPLADALRNSFVGELQSMTEFIKKLTIPCYVIGMGIRAVYNYENKGLKFAYDDVAYDFMKAILEKSAIVGIRGEITAAYLEKLGFIPEKDFTIIGCPSMYGFGSDLKVKDLNLNENSKISINNNIITGENVQQFLLNTCKKYRNYSFFPQRINELKMLYLGCDYKHKRNSPLYPDNIRYDVYKEDKVKFYIHVYHWLKELSSMDISIGPRLHGNVAALLSGTPALFIMHDARMRELVNYHNFPYIFADDIKNSDNLDNLIQNIDFNSFLKGHRQRFEHYVDFLNKNNLPNIFKDYQNPINSPFDLRLKKLKIDEKDYSVKSILRCSNLEILDRFNDIYSYDSLKPAKIMDGEEIPDENIILRENFENLKEELKLVKKELKEAKRGAWYIFKRKIRGYLNKKSAINMDVGGTQGAENKSEDF